MNHRLVLSVVLCSSLFVAVAARAADPQYKALKTIPVGGLGSWDYLSVDSGGHRLYVSHGTKVVVIDTEQDKVVGEILDTPGVHGFVAVPDLKRGFSSNGQENKASIVDLETLKTISKVQTGGNPDALLYEPASGEIYTFNGRSHDATAFEAKTGKVVATITLSGKPETGVADPKAGRIYVNIEDKNEVAVIDTKEHKVVATWTIAPQGENATGMAFDPDLHRLIIGCNNMLMMDSTNGKIVASVPCGQGVDAAAYDPGTHLAFVSAGAAGNVTIAKVEADKLTVVQTLSTEGGARTMTLDPKTHKIYLSNNPTRTDANGFKVLVFGTEP